jgi:hypothetical protein
MLTPNSFAYSEGFNSSPLPFPCCITPRSSKHVEVIEKEHDSALDDLVEYTAVTSKVS